MLVRTSSAIFWHYSQHAHFPYHTTTEAYFSDVALDTPHYVARFVDAGMTMVPHSPPVTYEYYHFGYYKAGSDTGNFMGENGPRTTAVRVDLLVVI